MNNHLKLRLANIAFNVLKIAKHWKMQDVIWTQKKWDKYLSERKKKPKFTPVTVPEENFESAKKLRRKLLEDGLSMDNALNQVEKEYGEKGNLRKDKAKKIEEIWNKREEIKKQERSEKDKIRLKQKREEHKKTYEQLKEEGKFVYGRKKYKKVKIRFSGNGEELFNETFHVKVGGKKPKNLLTKDNEEELKNQLLQFHKDRSGWKRVRTDAQLKQEFLNKMNPASYSSMKEFNAAKDRIQKMDSGDFMAMVHSIWEDEDDEKEIVDEGKNKNKPKKSPSKQQPKKDNRSSQDIVNDFLV